MAIIKVDYGTIGGISNITPVISGYTSSTTGTGIKGYEVYKLQDSSIASYSSGTITINKKGIYRIGVFLTDLGSYTQRLVIGGENISITATNYYSFIRELNVGDTIYFNRIDISGTTKFSLDVDLLS
jgi:hypothetical protein